MLNFKKEIDGDEQFQTVVYTVSAGMKIIIIIFEGLFLVSSFYLKFS